MFGLIVLKNSNTQKLVINDVHESSMLCCVRRENQFQNTLLAEITSSHASVY